MAQLNTYTNSLGEVVPVPSVPTTAYAPNGIARITPKSDRPLAKAAYVIWLAAIKAGESPGPFVFNGLTYTP